MKNITVTKTEFNTITEFIFSFEQSENHLPNPVQKHKNHNSSKISIWIHLTV